ncbi:MAG: class III cytochrome C family protein [Magnetococcales bacterium]|nr:class III cytochrome C family protein [Magnetococcales bacterium]
MNPTIKYLLWLNLGVIALLVFIYPHLMISPGSLIKGHAILERDCFACHTPLFGASEGKCVACHKVKDIGMTTSKGVPLTEKKTKVPFHQKLLGQDCVACHSDHAGIAKFRVSGRFSHQLLEETTRSQCTICHQRPGDSLHRQASERCNQCHGMNKWKPAQFNHDLLSLDQRGQCANCHKTKAPADTLHRQAGEKCALCHTVTKWKPASFDHNKYFTFDRDHNVKCAICHPGEDFKKYTCYGCHEHSVAKVRKKHVKEGINDYERCVLCHRNADEHAAKDLWRSGRWRDGLSGVPANLNEGDAGFPGQTYGGSGGNDEGRRRDHKKHRDHDDDD